MIDRSSANQQTIASFSQLSGFIFNNYLLIADDLNEKDR